MKKASPASAQERLWTRSFRTHTAIGFAVLIFGLGGGVVWATTAPLSGAVVSSGNLVVESNAKKVQHPTGGVVAELFVRDGMQVKAGDLVLRLDETITRSNLMVLTKQLDELWARMSRLEAERDGDRSLRTPAGFKGRMGEEDIKRLVKAETTLFEARFTSREGQRTQLSKRIEQLGEEIIGLNAQLESKVLQLQLIDSELKGVQELYAKKLVPINRVTSLQREAARLEGERGQLIASVAETKGKISENQLQIIRVEQEFRTDVLKDLRESQGKEVELIERRVAAEDQLKRVELRAPQSGLVHQLAIHTVGGVVSPAEIIMLIVPQSDDLQIEVHVQPHEIDQLRLGQHALVRLSAFNQRTTPEIQGIVTRISADLTKDQQTGAQYYVVRVSLPPEQLARVADLRLVPGMPAETFMETGSRTMMSYLMKPLRDQLNRTFRER